MSFDEWLKKNGHEKEREERYTLSRQYLYEIYLEELGDNSFTLTK